MGALQARGSRTVRIGAMADLHCNTASHGQLAPLMAAAAAAVDILLLGGDLTDHGSVEEAQVLAHELGGLEIPILAVLGNHDYESGQVEALTQVLRDAGVHLLIGDSHEVLGVGFAGIKGFCGGFGRGTLGSWGEDAVKRFVNEAVQEALHLESALARLKMPERIALLHYSPIEATVEGEPREIFPFLGCGRLAEPLSRYPVTAVFHGHAHRGSLEGCLASGTPVYNVSMPLLKRAWPDRLPMRTLDVQVPIVESVNG